jgi:hypothetical protein
MKNIYCLPSLKETTDLINELEKLNKVGIDYACVRLIKLKPTHENEIADVTFYSDEEWGKHYIENNYSQHDKIDRVANKFSSVCAPWHTISENS